MTVAVLGDTAKRNAPTISDADLNVDWFSGTGKGGQHRNKHQNSCRLTHVPTGIMRSASTRDRKNSYRLAREALEQAILEETEIAAAGAENSVRRSLIGSGMRGDKRRTYRFRDNQVVDHVTGKHAVCSQVMRGAFDLLW